jgi:hypothetical protein
LVIRQDGVESKMNQDEYTRNVLKTNPLVRHLFNKRNCQVKAIRLTATSTAS